jgi:hypothetical protein
VRRPFLRRFGAALVFPFAVSMLVPPALAADESRTNAKAVASSGDGSKEPAARPRHGARSKAADGTLVLFDNVYGIYVVPDHKDTYWLTDHFYRYETGIWLTSAAIGGPWELVPAHLVPDEAVQKYGTLKEPVTAKLPWNVEAVYDPALKAYKVVGRKGVFLFDGSFYRYDNGIWLTGKREDGPWVPASVKLLPPTLKKGVPAPESGQTVTLPDGTVVVYDSDAKIFRRQNRPDTALFDGKFFERREDKWFASPTAEGTFEEVAAASVPVPVRLLFKKPVDSQQKNASKPKDPAKQKDPAKKKDAAKQKKAKQKKAQHKKTQQDEAPNDKAQKTGTKGATSEEDSE